MKSDKIKVRFYVEKDGDILAVFPHEKYHTESNPHLKLCYAHVGQHSAASKGYYSRLPKATPEQYKSLADELTSIGYDLQILNK